MEPSVYYVQTISNAVIKIAPILGFIVLGWLIFIKLPFLFFLKNMHQSKRKIERAEAIKDSSADQKTERKQEKKREQKQEQKQEYKKQSKAPSRDSNQFEWACKVFKFNPQIKISKQELKKRYFEVLRENHPDRVASMGEDFRKLAERKTKEINKAYDTLKSKAS